MAVKIGANNGKVSLINKGSSININKSNTPSISLADQDGVINLVNKSGRVDLTSGSDATLPIYSGEYEVIPKVEEDTTLATTGYAMAKDVVVKEIPHYEVKNSAGGTTFTIGK